MNVPLWLERFAEHLEMRNLSERTRESYRLEARAFLHFLADRAVDQPAAITRHEVEAYRVHLMRSRKPDGMPLTPATQSAKITGVQAFLRFLHQGHFVLVNPGRDLPRPRRPETLPRELLDEEQVLRLLEQPDTTRPLGLRDRAILEVLYSSAIRNTEMCLLTLEDLDLHRLELRIQHGKGRKPRVVPLGEPAAAWLEEYLRNGRPWLVREPNTFVFLGWRGRGLSREDLAQAVRRQAEDAGLGRVTPHVLRHCCATHMLRRQAGLRHLQKLLGHSSADTTQRYTRVEISDLREVHQRCHPREAF
ncbi:tyrosine-type recombinase/integrase [Nocardioides sp.]|uniref:tyrosine-type recombinase/integrase n=1 Tax=Nocardioides sp. TaxID=35761 RepID=UPI003D0E8A72